MWSVGVTLELGGGGGGVEREHNEGWEEGYNSVHSLRKSTESFYEEVYGKITFVGRK